MKPNAGSVPSMGSHQRVLADVLASHRTTRSDLVASSGLSAATVSRAVDALLGGGVIREVSDVETTSRGRRRVLLEVDGSYAHVAGVDIGASSCRIVVANLSAEPVRRIEVATPSSLSPRDFARWLATRLEEVQSGSSSVERVCIGLPGAVQVTSRSVSNAPNLPQVEAPEFLDELDRLLQVPVELDNDANYALLGEQKFGAAVAVANAGMLTIGAGLGGAVCLNNQIIQGRHGIVGEFGHLLVGPLGSRLETLVTGPMLVNRAAELGSPIASPAELFGEHLPHALQPLVMQFDNAVLVALTALIVSSDPELVVVGGGIAKSLAPRLPRYEDELQRNLGFHVPLALATLGDFSGAIGAAAAGLQSTYREMGVPAELVAGLPRGARPDGALAG